MSDGGAYCGCGHYNWCTLSRRNGEQSEDSGTTEKGIVHYVERFILSDVA